MDTSRRDLLMSACACLTATTLACRPTASAALAAEAGRPRFSAVPPAHVVTLGGLPRGLTGAIVRRATASIERAPNAVARLHVEGGYAGKPDYDVGSVAQRDLASIRDLALAWRITGDTRHRDAVIRYLDAWTTTYRVSLNPIDEESFERVMLAADLLRGSLPAPTEAGLDGLLAGLATGYLDFIEASRSRRTLRGTDKNNWNSHRVKIATLAAFAGGGAELIARARNSFDLQVARNIAASGEVIDFAERDALHYVVYSLQPLVTACAAAAAHGESWIERIPGPDAGSVRGGIAWLLPYVAGAKTHEEFVNSTVRFDAERAAAGVAGFKGTWKRELALDLMALAAHVDPGFRPDYERLVSATGRQASDWLRILFPIA